MRYKFENQKRVQKRENFGIIVSSSSSFSSNEFRSFLPLRNVILCATENDYNSFKMVFRSGYWTFLKSNKPTRYAQYAFITWHTHRGPRVPLAR